MRDGDLPEARRLYDVIDATWPPAAMERRGPWMLRRGDGGGQRVSAATVAGDWSEADIAVAEAGMAEMGQDNIFMIRDGDDALDAALERRGYRIVDPVNLYAAPVAVLTDRPLPRVTAFTIWPPLAIMEEIWADGDIGPARLAVMDRVTGPRTGILGRMDDAPAAAAFVAMDGEIAMLHALHVMKHQRRKNMGAWAMRAAGHWARAQGARVLSLAVTQANAPANALYVSLGMQTVGHYHYRRKDRSE